MIEKSERHDATGLWENLNARDEPLLLKEVGPYRIVASTARAIYPFNSENNPRAFKVVIEMHAGKAGMGEQRWEKVFEAVFLARNVELVEGLPGAEQRHVAVLAAMISELLMDEQAWPFS